MKLSELFPFFLCLSFFAFVGCKNCDCEPEPQEPDEPAVDHSLNQPDDPDKFSLVGKTYICEETYVNSPASDNYWVHVYHFDSDFELTHTQTPNRDLTPHEDFSDLVEHYTYTFKYPNLQLSTGAIVELLDTLTIFSKATNRSFVLYIP